MKSKSKGVSLHTVVKQKILIHFMASYARRIDPKKVFHYTDMNSAAGTWDIPEFGKCFGSPVIAFQIFKQLPLFESLLIEGDVSRYKELKTLFETYADPRVKVQCTDNALTADLVEDVDQGLIYYDPCTSPNYNVVLDAAKAAPKQDILIHVGPGLTKRNQGRITQNVKPELQKPIAEYFQQLGKKYNYVTEPDKHSKQQWVLAYSSNDGTFVPPPEFIDITSEQGKALLYFLSNIKSKDDEEDESAAIDAVRQLLDAPETWAAYADK